MEEKQVQIFNEIFSALDGLMDTNEEDFDGLQTLGAILNLSEENFDLIKDVFLNNIENTFNQVDTKIALAQMINNNGITFEDLENNLDNLVEAINGLATEGIELSENKKDFLKQIFTIFLNSMESTKAISKRIIQIPIQKLSPDVKLPTYATDGSAAMDLYSPEEYTIKPGDTVVIPLGFKVALPKGYALLIQPRSGMSIKTKLRIPNSPGLIDSDYHEEIGVIVENIEEDVKDVAFNSSLAEFGDELVKLYGSSYTIGKGERFAQMRLIEVPLVNWLEVSNLGSFDNDHGKGFGGTGAT